MPNKLSTHLPRASWLFLAGVLLSAGCTSANVCISLPDGTAPRELKKIIAPDYVISPPDILLLDAVRLVPQPPYKVAPLDALVIQVNVFRAPTEAELAAKQEPSLIPGQPINGLFRVEPDGVVNLRFSYGAVPVVGQTIPEAKESIKKHLQKRFKLDFEVDVGLGESRAMQFIRGEHLVRPDGKVSLGSYGSVSVAGLTMEQAQKAIQDFVSDKLLDPEISLDVAGYNSMVYYVIFDQAGAGQSIARLPFTGNETVLDALGQLKGLPPGSDRLRIWVARPTQPEEACDQIMPVDLTAITKRGSTATNYQLLPGDRLYVSVDPLVALDGYLARIIAPIERISGIILLGNSTYQQIKTPTTGGGL